MICLGSPRSSSRIKFRGRSSVYFLLKKKMVGDDVLLMLRL